MFKKCLLLVVLLLSSVVAAVSPHTAKADSNTECTTSTVTTITATIATTTCITPLVAALPAATPTPVNNSYWRYSGYANVWGLIDDGGSLYYMFDASDGLNPGDQVEFCFSSVGLWESGINFYAKNGNGSTYPGFFYNYRHVCHWYRVDNTGVINVYLDNTGGNLSRSYHAWYRYYYLSS